MKFSELPYTRPDLDVLSEKLDQLTRRIQNAESVQEQIQVVHEFDTITNDFATMTTIAHIRSTCNSNDKFYADEKAYCDSIAPLAEEKTLAVRKALYDSPFRKELEEAFGPLLFTNMEMDARAFSPELIPLMQEESRLVREYQSLCAGARISFDGKILTLSELGAYKSSPDRELRRKALIAEGTFFDDHQAQFDKIFDDLVKNRTEQAHRLGMKNYVELGYLRRKRNCYTPKDVDVFRKQVIADVVPINMELKKEQAQEIGVDQLRFWDNDYFYDDGNPAPQGTYDEILAAGRKMYTELSPETADFIKQMMDDDMFDVLPHEGKAPGGFCSFLPNIGSSFIYSNFNGTAGDVDVLTHEAGHAFFNYMSRSICPALLRKPSQDGCETHSMSMEFLTAPWHHLFFGEQTDKYERFHAQSALLFIPYGCMVDHFQELVYIHPNWTPEQRNEAWLWLEKQYRPYLDFEDLPFYSRGAGWQRQRHIYLYPFYYIDYAMAQTMSLQFWARSLKDWPETWKQYLKFLSYGGTRTFIDIVEQVGLLSPLKEGTMASICGTIKQWLDEHQLH